MVSWEKVISVVLVLLIMVLWIMFYYNPEGGLNTLKGVTNSIKDYVGFGSAEITGAKPTVLPAHQAAINRLKNSMKTMHNAQNQFCFARYKDVRPLQKAGSGFPPLGDSNNVYTSIVLSYGKNKEGKEGIGFAVLGGVGGKQEVSYEFIEGIKPCVIAGPHNVVEKFSNAFLNTKPWEVKKRDMLRDYAFHFNPVEVLTITYSSSVAGSGNIIHAQFKEGGSINSDLLDGGIIYTPDKKHICFFPTVDDNALCAGIGFAETDSDGLDDDCLGNDDPAVGDGYEDNNIINQLNKNSLLECEAAS